MNKKIAISLSIVGAIVVIAIGGTIAYFSNTETSPGNTFIAGAIDLKVDSTCIYNGQTVESCTWAPTDLDDELFFNFDDVKPGDEGEDTISLHVDSNPAWICAEVSNIVSSENGCNPPEKIAEADCELNEDGELWDNLYFSIWLEDDCDNIYEPGEGETYVIQNVQASDIQYPIADSQTGGTPITDKCVGVAWYVPPGTGNEIQSDSVTGDITFKAYQSKNNDSFVCVAGDGCFDQADVMLVLDRSGSINTTELGQLKTAAHVFVTVLNPNGGVHMGQTSFSDNGTLDLHLTNNKTAIDAAIDSLISGGYTNLYEGIHLAKVELDDANAYERPLVPDYMVIITDGNPNRPTPDSTARTMAANEADAARAAGVEVYVVGVGNDVDATYLINNIADDLAHYFAISNYSELEDLLEAIANCQQPPQNIGTLTVNKVVVNDEGGTKGIGDFSLFVSGYPVTSGAAVNFPTGGYTVTETGNQGYAATFSGDCDSGGNVTIGAGDNKTCTITNDDNPQPVSIFSDNFNDGDYDGWTAVCFQGGGYGGESCSSPQYDVSAMSGGSAYDGYSVRIEDDAGINRTVSTAGRTNIQLKYCRRTQSTESSDRFRIGWKTGSNSSNWASYNQLEAVQDDSGWTCVTQNLPSSANNTTISIAFFLDNDEGDYGWVDNVEVLGQ
jgi:predicted ribosomally synthesized peptide with SipW-like signal peptide